LRDGIKNRRNKFLYWMHCSSLGEFEQGRPLLEKLKESRKDSFILLTFYSPSGYLKSKNYPLADYIGYLPLDTPRNAKKFLELTKPDQVVFVKYDLWYFFLREVHNNRIPLILTSAYFPQRTEMSILQISFLKKVLFFFTHIFIQEEKSGEFLKEIDFENFTIAGDVRVDRVLEIAHSPFKDEIIEDFTVGKKTLICGSIWEKDSELILEWIKTEMNENWVVILAPHKIDRSSISKLCQKIHESYSLYSDYRNDSRILIIDNIGKLSRLYRYGDIAYIGGGFGKSIHNTLEPAVYGLPVIFGPRYKKFPEAISLKELGGGFEVRNIFEFKKTMDALRNDTRRTLVSQKVKTYINQSSGATSIIEQKIRKI
ncbi:MAG: hypothetical protein RJA52_118, partial [Bacteroidota bacterium]